MDANMLLFSTFRRTTVLVPGDVSEDDKH